MSVRASQAAGCSAGGRAAREAVHFDRLFGVVFFLPATWAGVSILNGGLLFFIDRGCVSQMLKVDALDLLIREIVILGMLSLVWVSRIPTVAR